MALTEQCDHENSPGIGSLQLSCDIKKNKCLKAYATISGTPMSRRPRFGNALGGISLTEVLTCALPV